MEIKVCKKCGELGFHETCNECFIKENKTKVDDIIIYLMIGIFAVMVTIAILYK
jgi:hypothetical protein